MDVARHAGVSTRGDVTAAAKSISSVRGAVNSRCGEYAGIGSGPGRETETRQERVDVPV